MADVFSQMYIHLVFCPARREALIRPEWEERLYKYITGIVQKRGHKLLAIGGMSDHIHILIGFKPVESVSDLVREIKTASTDFVRAENLSPFKFNWQKGYGVFTCSKSDLHRVCQYILNQKEHHRKVRFKEEFTGICHDFGIEMGKKINFEFFN